MKFLLNKRARFKLRTWRLTSTEPLKNELIDELSDSIGITWQSSIRSKPVAFLTYLLCICSYATKRMH